MVLCIYCRLFHLLQYTFCIWWAAKQCALGLPTPIDKESLLASFEPWSQPVGQPTSIYSLVFLVWGNQYAQEPTGLLLDTDVNGGVTHSESVLTGFGNRREASIALHGFGQNSKTTKTSS